MHAAIGPETRFLGRCKSQSKELCQTTEDLSFAPKPRVTKNVIQKNQNSSSSKLVTVKGFSDSMSDSADHFETDVRSDQGRVAKQTKEEVKAKSDMPDSFRNSGEATVVDQDERVHNNGKIRIFSQGLDSDDNDNKVNEKDSVHHSSIPVESKSSESMQETQMSDLTSKIHELHATLARLRQESEDQIEKLKQESENASKTIERLQHQLQQQSDYNLLKREIQVLRGATDPSTPALSAPANVNNPMASTPSSTTSSLTLTPPPPVPLTSGPPSGVSPSALISTMTPTSLEQLLVERAKALRQANPALKAFADIQGPAQLSALSGSIRHPLFPPPAGLPQGIEALGLMNDEMVAQWRQTLQRSPLSGLGIPPYHLGVPPNRSSGDSQTPVSSTPPTLGSGRTPERIGSPSNGHSSPVHDRADSNCTPANGGSNSNAQSDIDEEDQSPARLDSKSPFKSDERPSPNLPVSFPGPTGLNLQFPLHMPVSPLVTTGRIPKSDPMEGRLQDMLRYNMEKYAGQALDTLNTSRRVRELLSIHNIGQRLFAKYVLGLSQGTVSELLSKPKSWEKLTEKGRDSYRKMHAWAYDENAVMMLKSLIPRKGELMRPISSAPLLIKDDRVQSGFQFTADSSEDRMANSAKDRSSSPTTKGPNLFSNQLLGSNPMSDDNPHDNLSKIYKEEFSRIMQDASRLAEKPEALGMAGLPFFPGIGAASGFFQRGGSDFQRAMDIYHQEFSRLQQNAIAAALRAHQGESDSTSNREESSARDEADDNMEVNDHQDRSQDKPNSPVASERSGPTSPADSRQDSPLGKGPGSKLFPPPPLQHIGEDLAGSLSPLQRMASITNSLVSQPSMPHQPGQQHRSHRAVLPPITQQQFDRFQHLNTEDVVRRVKEILSQYSISQRLFGEHVLALSQGSVSDLLARPKPWHMLTQKGREPFIRMKLFLDDENAVHKLVASQYKIAPDKLMRTGNYSGQLPLPSKQLGKLPDFPTSMHDVLPASFRFGGTPESLQERPPPILDPLALQRKLLSQKPGSNLGGGVIPTAPSLYEMAALTHELDTQAVTTKVKEILLANNVGQKLFGEAVLGLSQGSVSELLSKPKPWHMLSIKGREPFIRMQLWLNDPQNIEKLQSLKNERKDPFLTKRKRIGGMDSSSDRSSPADSSDVYANPVDSPGSAKKQRVLFTDEQKEALNIAFQLEPYPSTATMDFLSQELNLEQRTISNWFHNHRMRLKQTIPQAAEQLNLFAAKEGQNFDVVKFRLLFHQRMMEIRSDDSGSRGAEEFPPNFSTLLRHFGSFHSPFEQLNSREPKDEKDMVGGGLDLTFKRDNDDKDSIAESDSEDSNSNKNVKRIDPESESEDRPVISVSSRSRRKPVAPQWVRPDWMESGEENESKAGEENASKCVSSDKENNLTINGVCVMNSYAATMANKSPTSEKPDDKNENIL